MKLRYTLWGIFVLLFQLFAFAQEYELDWVNVITETYQGHVYKQDQMGLDIEVASNGDIIVAGIFADTVDFDPGSGKHYSYGPSQICNGFIARYAPSGNLIWQISLAYEYGLVSLTSLSLDSQDQIYVTGFFYKCLDFDPSPDTAQLCGQTNGKYSTYVAKYDGNGNYLWARAAIDIGRNGPINQKLAYDMNIDEPHNAVYFITQFQDSIDANLSAGVQKYYTNGGYDLAIIKLDLDGNYLWSKHIGGTGNESVSDLDTDKDGNLIYTGHFENMVDFDPAPTSFNLSCPVPANNNIFFTKMTGTGQLVWAKQLQSSELQSERLVLFNEAQLHVNIELDEMDNIIMASRFKGSVDLDPGPGSEIMSSNGVNDFFLARYASDGSYYWAKRINVSEKTNWYARIADLRLNGDDIYITGTADDTMDYDVATPNGDFVGMEKSGFIAKYNRDGAYQWAHHHKLYGASANFLDIGQVGAICFDKNDYFYVTGIFGGTTDFDDDGDTLTHTLNGIRDMFITRYNDTIPIGISENYQQQVSFSLYPNPASEEVFVSLTGGNKRLQLEITDALGRQITKQRINKPVFKLDVSQYPKGLYFVRVSDGEVVGVRKLVVR